MGFGSKFLTAIYPPVGFILSITRLSLKVTSVQYILVRSSYIVLILPLKGFLSYRFAIVNGTVVTYFSIVYHSKHLTQAQYVTKYCRFFKDPEVLEVFQRLSTAQHLEALNKGV